MCHLDTVLFLLQNWSKIFCKKFTLTLTDLRMTQKALSQTMVTRDGRRIVTRWLSTMFFFWDQSDFYCPGRNCPWLLHIGNLMSWLWKYQTLTICWAVTDCTHLWNDAVILELLLQQSVFLLQCLNLVKSILTNIVIFVKFWESTWLERRSFSAEMPWWTERIIVLETTLSNTSFSSIT